MGTRGQGQGKLNLNVEIVLSIAGIRVCIGVGHNLKSSVKGEIKGNI